MRKMMLTLTTVGLLAVPAGMAFAQSDDNGPAEPVPTCVDPEQDRDRDRDRDRTGDQTVPGAPDQQTQLRTQEHLQDGHCDGDCPGDQVQNQHRVQDQAHLADGDGAMHRRGETGGAGNG
jgi:hypothetical protein